MTKNPILTTAQLAEELRITEAEALELMRSDSFPATHIAGDSYAVAYSLLEAWIRTNARTVQGINDGSEIFPDYLTHAREPRRPRHVTP